MYIKLVNKILKKIQGRCSGRLWYFPSKISIETGNICNLKCPLCPTSDKLQEHVARGALSLENFKIIFNKIRPFAKTIDLFSWGEPFLNKDIGGIVQYAREEKRDLRVFIDSNLNIITDDAIEKIVRYNLNVLKVSCDGATQGIYEKYRAGGDIEKVFENIRRILRKKEELEKDTPRIIWKYLVFKHNEHEVDLARGKASDLGIEFEASGMRTDCGKEIFEKIEDAVKRDKAWIPDSDRYNNYRDLNAGREKCEKPWRTLTVNWNGDCLPCGAIYDCARYSFGNLLTQSFQEVWNSEKFALARKIISDKGAENSDIICSICKKNGYQFF